MESNKGNELIADFMGWELITNDPICSDRWVNKDGEMVGNRFSKRLDFHNSWDWLMPVVEKIESLTTTDGRGEVHYIVSIEADSCIISVGGESEIVYCQAYDTGKNKKEVVFEAVVEFIQWMNYEQGVKIGNSIKQ
jgi:hypothetical protein